MIEFILNGKEVSEEEFIQCDKFSSPLEAVIDGIKHNSIIASSEEEIIQIIKKYSDCVKKHNNFGLLPIASLLRVPESHIDTGWEKFIDDRVSENKLWKEHFSTAFDVLVELYPDSLYETNTDPIVYYKNLHKKEDFCFRKFVDKKERMREEKNKHSVRTFTFFDKNKVLRNLLEKNIEKYILNLDENNLSQIQLLTLLHCIHGNKKLTDTLRRKVPPENFIQRRLKEEEFKEKISKYYSETGKVNHLKGFPADEVWRLCVDFNFQKEPEEKGWARFEKEEKGSVRKIANALHYSLKQKKKEKITVEYIKELHRIATEKLDLDFEAGEFFGGKAFDLLFGDNLTYAGYFSIIDNYSEFVELVPTHKKNCFLARMKFFQKSEYYDERVKNYEEKIYILINDYYTELGLCNNDPVKILKAIIKLSCSSERLHPFFDGNCRVFCVVLLNKELVYNGFPPVALDDPNRFDGLTEDEMLDEVIIGMDNFYAIKNNNLPEEIIKNNLTTSELEESLKDDEEYYDVSKNPTKRRKIGLKSRK